MAALQLFQDMIESYEPPPTPPAPYDRLGLLKLCCTHAGPRGSQSLTDAALAYAGIDSCLVPLAPPKHDAVTDAVTDAATSFADHLVDSLFLPLRAVAQCRSVVKDTDSSDDDDDDADDGAAAVPRTRTESRGPQTLYIFPPSPMTQIDDDGEQVALPALHTSAPRVPCADQQPESGALAACLLSRLALVEEDAVQLLRHCEHTDANKITLVTVDSGHDWSALFSRFQAVVKGAPRTIQQVDGAAASTASVVDTGLDTADACLLALHATIAHILSASGADAYIDSILADTGLEDMDAAGGTSHLGRLMTLRLDGWWDGGRGNRGKSAESMFWIESSHFAEE